MLDRAIILCMLSVGRMSSELLDKAHFSRTMLNYNQLPRPVV